MTEFFVERTETQPVTLRTHLGLRCNKCHKLYLIPMEVQEFVRVHFTGGYGSIFGDGDIFCADICQYCLAEWIGKDLETVEDCTCEQCQQAKQEHRPTRYEEEAKELQTLLLVLHTQGVLEKYKDWIESVSWSYYGLVGETGEIEFRAHFLPNYPDSERAWKELQAALPLDWHGVPVVLRKVPREGEKR